MLPIHQEINDLLYSDQDSTVFRDYYTLQGLKLQDISWQSALPSIDGPLLRAQAVALLMNRHRLVEDPTALQALGSFIDEDQTALKRSWEMANGDTSSESITLSDQLWRNYQEAKQSWAQKDTTAAIALYKTLTINPFFAPGVLQAAEFFNQIGAPDQSYQILLESMNVNRYEPQILGAYAKQCVRMNLDTYAQVALNELRSILSEEQWLQFAAELEQIRQTVQTQEQWDDSEG